MYMYVSYNKQYCYYLIAPACGALETPANGQQTSTGIFDGGVSSFSCDSGYILGGSATRTCEVVGGLPNWTGVETQCTGKWGYNI